ncbi:hypothetical protein Aph02nite_17340 [Actinoplanes philippinensis]|uniref:Collagen triple helix repeat-containing protein n=1 Tax=Actinoplanes philippinensis TaxID=35752 RepID=A0A1I2B9Y0_9ACTN|nr:hypothetical protein [Actinoplanes philippinensis]GIE75784.1 hypothetical protein Aph02nite_17340 [Actinoplanes philippinensis]SFE52955.1 hypothetical protein SAMN05421541_102198 [Actinoplanes philippinensis]
MASWILVPCLDCLRDELNLIAPNRDKTTDGTIGDAAHQQHVSDHNDDEVGKVPIRDADSKHEVHAVDLDADLRTPGLTMEMVVQHIVARCRSGAEKRLRYVIYNRRIWEASNGWKQRDYDGDSPHTEHAHFSASYETAHEASTASWGLDELKGEDDMLVRKGDSGEEVKFWQFVLGDLGYGPVLGTVDGDYGPKMEAAVNAHRKALGQNSISYISGYHGFAMLREMMNRRAGKAGPAGPAGAPGPQGSPGPKGDPGPAGELTGTLTVTGGQLTVEAQ